VPVDDIVVIKERFRQLTRRPSVTLRTSIEQLSLIHPPTVYFAKPKGKSEFKMYLNSGQHRWRQSKAWLERDRRHRR